MNKKKFLVVGLGQFGTNVARGLARHGQDVTAVDSRERRVNQLLPEVPRALVIDATDEHSLEELRIDSFDAVLVCMGEESLEGSILSTAILRQLGARKLVARAVSEVHGRILVALGVDEVVYPEETVADQLALRLAARGLVSYFDFGEGVTAVEFKVPEEWVGRSLKDLDLRRLRGINVVAVRRAAGTGGGVLVPDPSPEQPFARGEGVLVLGMEDKVNKLLEELF